ncbi:TPA: hypothetical protein RQN23_002999 [Aeromonas veronii]|nr:hypothetical protein [Aeromonas veronii]
MLFSNLTLSVYNNNLTADTVRWMLKNALSIDPNMLFQLKAGANADHPLMKEESLYDDLPVEVQALFVMEPYFPRKHFDRAFAWLFGKESIAEIDADSFAHYEALVDKNTCYTLRDFWQDLPFTREEYCHIFNEFNKLTSTNDGYQFSSCRIGLLKHACITPEIYSQELSARTTAPHINVCSDIATLYAEKCMGKLKASEQKRRNKNTPSELNLIEGALYLNNLPREKRDEILTMFDPQEIGLYGIKLIYNEDIPDDVLHELLSAGVIDAECVLCEMSILSDMRLPEKDATKIAFSHPIECAKYYLKRSDVKVDVREAFLLEMIAKLKGDKFYNEYHTSRVMEKLVLSGALTMSEINLLQGDYKSILKKHIFDWAVTAGIELPPAVQDEWIGSEFNTRSQLKYYHDVPALLESIKFHYTKESSIGCQPKKIMGISFHSVLLNTGWTKELLFELIDVTRIKQVDSQDSYEQDSFRQELFCKLFSESFYPSLDKADLTGPYGRAESLLARLLDGDAGWLSNPDIDLIVNSPICLDYADHEVDLAASLARNPDINERIVAERLRLRVDQIGDAPTLARQRRAL